MKIEESALDSLKAMVQQLQDERDMLLWALIDARSVTSSVNTGYYFRVVHDGCVMYLQTEEWCKWVDEEVNDKVCAAIASCTETKQVLI